MKNQTGETTSLIVETTTVDTSETTSLIVETTTVDTSENRFENLGLDW